MTAKKFHNDSKVVDEQSQKTLFYVQVLVQDIIAFRSYAFSSRSLIVFSSQKSLY